MSIKVTLRSSPGLGGSKWACKRDEEEEKGRLEGKIVEEATEIAKELYLAVIIDRAVGLPVIIASESGGMVQLPEHC